MGTEGLLAGTLPPILFDEDIIAIAHAGAAAFGSGYHHIYHIFLPPGQDVCFTGTNECYSPDNPDTFFFCAFHASVDFSDIGHVLLTVEPYQNVNGCSVVQPSPNGPIVDSTADVLSHELFETITDPDGTAWWNRYDLDLFGAEIGDECQNFDFGYGTWQSMARSTRFNRSTPISGTLASSRRLFGRSNCHWRSLPRNTSRIEE